MDKIKITEIIGSFYNDLDNFETDYEIVFINIGFDCYGYSKKDKRYFKCINRLLPYFIYQESLLGKKVLALYIDDIKRGDDVDLLNEIFYEDYMEPNDNLNIVIYDMKIPQDDSMLYDKLYIFLFNIIEKGGLPIILNSATYNIKQPMINYNYNFELFPGLYSIYNKYRKIFDNKSILMLTWIFGTNFFKVINAQNAINYVDNELITFPKKMRFSDTIFEREYIENIQYLLGNLKFYGETYYVNKIIDDRIMGAIPRIYVE